MHHNLMDQLKLTR